MSTGTGQPSRRRPASGRRERSKPVGLEFARPASAASPAGPSTAIDPLARLRHDLCTPAAHIQGYAEMLQEEAVEQGCEAWVPDLQRIEQAGRSLVERVRDLLAPERIAKSGLDLRHAHAELRTPLNHVVGYGEILLERAEDEARTALVPDLRKIQTAARRFLELMTEHLVPGVDGRQAVPVSPRASLDVPEAPVVVADPRARAMAVDAALSGRVLVVDDDRANRELLARRLERQGFEVVGVADGPAALRRLRRGGFDLVLLDLLMPGMGGDEVLARLKADAVLREIPVLMLSAVDDLDSVVRCILMGAEDYLAKPFNPVLLRARLTACLEKRRLRQREQEAARALEVERQKSENLLLNILPAPIASRLKRGERTIVDSLPAVTVLFADLVGFTALASEIDSVDMVRMLDEVFSGFDGLAEAQGLEKIKTIGDAYMVVGGLPTPRVDHAEAVAELALNMLAQIERQSRAAPRPIQLRLGIHSGPVIAGIIGRHKFSYDLWGDTVNTASRMESHGLPGCIQVTDTTYQLLKGRYAFEPRGEIAVKGKGTMTPWILKGRLRKDRISS